MTKASWVTATPGGWTLPNSSSRSQIVSSSVQRVAATTLWRSPVTHTLTACDGRSPSSCSLFTPPVLLMMLRCHQQHLGRLLRGLLRVSSCTIMDIKSPVHTEEACCRSYLQSDDCLHVAQLGVFKYESATLKNELEIPASVWQEAHLSRNTIFFF